VWKEQRFLEFHGKNIRILRAVLDLARSFGRNSSSESISGQNFWQQCSTVEDTGADEGFSCTIR